MNLEKVINIQSKELLKEGASLDFNAQLLLLEDWISKCTWGKSHASIKNLLETMHKEGFQISRI